MSKAILTQELLIFLIISINIFVTSLVKNTDRSKIKIFNINMANFWIEEKLTKTENISKTSSLSQISLSKTNCKFGKRIINDCYNIIEMTLS